MKTLDELKKYDTFRYKKYDIKYEDNLIKIVFYFAIDNLETFEPTLEIPVSNKKIDKDYVNYLVFNIGMIEAISYWKCVCPYNFIIECGYLDEKQEEFFRKIFYYGLGEFRYVNKIDVSYDKFINFISKGSKYQVNIHYDGEGKMIAVGGGKDSCVTLNLVSDGVPFMINPKKVMLECASVAGYSLDEVIKIKRTIDKNLLDLNNQGFLNGHTPFSAMVAFVSYLTAYLNNKNKIILANESSANEANVSGTKINHQYSKSFEFEQDFTNYQKEYLGNIIKYYSLLRPLTEYQIGMLFAKYKKYHYIFKSCNVGSKSEPWKWCGKCAKCLFVFALLSPYLYKEELVSIFNKDLFVDEELLPLFKELLGYENVKPFDCVGTFEEINYAIYKTINKLEQDNLPVLLKYYKEHYYKDLSYLDLEHRWNKEHNLDEEDIKLVRDAINDRENN